jgi:hypothetical protein
MYGFFRSHCRDLADSTAALLDKDHREHTDHDDGRYSDLCLYCYQNRLHDGDSHFRVYQHIHGPHDLHFDCPVNLRHG